MTTSSAVETATTIDLDDRVGGFPVWAHRRDHANQTVGYVHHETREQIGLDDPRIKRVKTRH